MRKPRDGYRREITLPAADGQEISMSTTKTSHQPENKVKDNSLIIPIKFQWVLFIFLITIGGILTITISLEYRRTAEREQERLLTQNGVVQKNAIKNLQSINAILGRLQKEIGQTGKLDRNMNERLKMFSEALPGVRTLLVTDERGIGIASSRPEVIIGKDLSNRDYFQAPLKRPETDMLFISRPFKTIATGIYAIGVSRMISGPDGKFSGVVSATLDPEYFSTLLSSALYAPDMRAAIVHHDGEIFMLQPYEPKEVGKNLYQPGTFFSRHRDSGQLLSTFSGYAYATGRNSLVVMSSVRHDDLKVDKPLVVATFRSKAAIYARFYRDALIEVALYLLLTLFSLVGCYLYRKRQQEHEAYAVHAAMVLRESEERLKSATQAAGVGVWEFIPSTGQLVWDETMFEIFDVDRSAFTSVYEEWRDALLPEDRPAAEAAVQSALTGGEPLDIVFRIQRRDGEVRFIRGTAKVTGGSDSSPVRLIGINEDITDRTQSEEKLVANERFLHMLADHLPGMVGYWNAELRCRFANSAYQEWFGKSSTEMHGIHFLELMGEELFRKNEPFIRAALQGEPQSFERTLVKADGSTGFTWAHYIPDIADGEVRGFFVLVSDITELKKAESRLVESESRLRTIIANEPECIKIVDAEGRLLEMNPAGLAMIEADSQEQVAGQPVLDLIAPEFHAAFSELHKRVLAGEPQLLKFEIIGLKGGRRWLETHAVPMVDNGNVVHLAVTRDITEQMLTEAQLRQSNSMLMEARNLAEAASRAKSDFLANMSHEIRTPMNAITGMTYLALQTELSSSQRDYLTKIQLSAESLLGIINDILDFSKIEAGKLELEEIPFNLGDVLEHVVSITGGRAEEKALELMISLPVDLPGALVGDPLRLGQVLGNLVGNAVKFTEQGHIVIAVEQAGPVADGKITLVFSVSDTGIGMNQDQMEHVFEAFSQADSSISRRFGGTGLGLSIVRRLLHLMETHLEVESESGKGSRFSFSIRMPVLDKQPQRRGAVPSDLREIRILVVDDNPAAREILSTMLVSFSFRVTTMASGEASLAELRQAVSAGDPYSLVFMDWQMPGMDGMETIRHIRNDASLAQPPAVIMVTAFGGDRLRRQVRQIDNTAYLTKPVQPSTLFNTVMELFGRSEYVAELHSKDFSSLQNGLKSIRGARVLIVEDNLINQQVAREIVEQAGIRVVMADNGRTALSAIERGEEFDAVLMDIQMPEMDGYEATRRIRQIRSSEKLPIIAMTAHAMAGEREKCLAAGMDDHVAKPINPQLLYGTIIKWIVPKDRTAAATTADPIPRPNESEDERPAQLPGININAALQNCVGNAGLFRSLIAEFREQNLNSCDAIRMAIEGNDFVQAAFLVHTLKGVSGTICADTLFATVCEIETALRKEDRETCSRLLIPMEKQMEDVFKAADILDRRSGRNSSNEGTSLPQEQLAQLVCELSEALRSNSLAAGKLFERIKRHIPSPQQEEIHKQIGRLEFKKARIALEQAAVTCGIDLQRGEHDQE
jgi:PAS domain S-box-containing protein